LKLYAHIIHLTEQIIHIKDLASVEESQMPHSRAPAPRPPLLPVGLVFQ
jgi:hypothetical protein